jgi:two-component system cell cycle response regulator
MLLVGEGEPAVRDESSSKTETAQLSDEDLLAGGDRSATLVVIRGEGLGGRFPLRQGASVIGRLPDVDISIPDRSLSRRHCEIHCVEQDGQRAYLLRDLDSTNGCYVNGSRVSEKYLRDGDKLSVGDVVLKFGLLDALEDSFQQELVDRLRHDHLTGLFNVTAFYEELDRELRSAQVSCVSLGLLMLDIDGLKRVNDAHGHVMGTEVVRSVARGIHRVVADAGGLAALYGGDEFIAFLPSKAVDQSVQLGEDIRRLVEETAVRNPQGGEVWVSVCVGVVGFPEHGQRRELLVRRADLALYQAKRGGRNRVVAYYPELEEAG